MLIARIIIYLLPLLIFPLLIKSLWSKNLKKDFHLIEFLTVSILTGSGIFLLVEFVLIQSLDFNATSAIISILLSVPVFWIYGKIGMLLFDNSRNINNIFLDGIDRKALRIITYIGLFAIVWYLATAAQLFNNPAIWWDEIIHWVPKAKILIESGKFSDVDKIPFPEYPRFWPLIMANFMLIQDKLTSLIPLFLYFIYWIFTGFASLRFIQIRKNIDWLPLALIFSGAFINTGWGAPYSDLPLSVFYSTALVVMFLILRKQIGRQYVIYSAILLGLTSEIRLEGILLSLVAVISFALIFWFEDKKYAVRSSFFQILVIMIFYLPWQIYILNHHIVNANSEVAVTGFNETWGHWGFMFQKIIEMVLFMWQEVGKVSHAYFVLFVFAIISIGNVMKGLEKSEAFGILVVLMNFFVVFGIILFSPSLSGGYGGLIWWLQTDFTRFTNHYLPFVFFISGIMLHRLHDQKKV